MQLFEQFLSQFPNKKKLNKKKYPFSIPYSIYHFHFGQLWKNVDKDFKPPEPAKAASDRKCAIAICWSSPWLSNHTFSKKWIQVILLQINHTIETIINSSQLSGKVLFRQKFTKINANINKLLSNHLSNL